MEAVESLSLTLLGLVLCCLLVVVERGEEGRLEKAVRVRDGEVVVAGARLYDEHCRKCHGARGEGLGQLGPALADHHFFTGRMAEVGWLLSLEEYIIATTAGGRMMASRPLYAGNGRTAVMPPWALDHGGPLRGDEIDALCRFVMNWQATAMGKITLPTIEMPPADLGNPATVKAGRQVFAQHCQSCHTLPGLAGGDGGPPLAKIGGAAAERVPRVSAADYIRQSILVPAAFVVEGYAERAEGPGCGAIFSEVQLEAVTAFLLQQQ
jgi:mono/diheme cytochrome c family protein